MQLAPATRRALGLSAAGALLLGATVTGLTGTAQAAPAAYTVTGSGPSDPVPAGICSVDWELTGGSGGADSAADAGAPGGALHVTTPASAGDVFTLHPGTAGRPGTSAPAGGAHGTNGYSADPGTEGTDGSTDGGLGAGGGGAASVVTRGGSLVALAFGGDGAGAPGSGGGGGANLAPDAGDSFDAAGTASGSGNGAIRGTGIPCAPSAPYLNYVEPGDRSLFLDFTDPGDGAVPAVRYEYTLDGTTWRPLTTTASDGRTEATVTGLTNGTTYSVQVRGVAGTGGTSDPSNAQDGTPRKVAGAPGSVTATTGPASLTVHWTAASPGDFRIAGYRVVSLWTTGQSGGAEPICSASATATSCTGPARAGVRHDLVVYAVDSRNGTGEWARVTTGKVPFTAAPPTPDGKLLPASGATAGGVHPGAEMTVSGAGYAPFSTVTVLIYSSPQVLASVAADGSGTFTTAVEVPAGLEAGHHTLVASGLDTSGTLRYLTLPVQVPAKAREKATGNDGSTGSGTLAYTGFDLIAPLTGGGAAVVLGAGLMVLARRRKAD